MADEERDYFTRREEALAIDCMAEGFSNPTDCAEGRGGNGGLAPSRRADPVVTGDSIVITIPDITDNFNFTTSTELENREFGWQFAELVESGEFNDLAIEEKIALAERMDYIVNKTNDLSYYTLDEGGRRNLDDMRDAIEEKLGDVDIPLDIIFENGNRAREAYSQVADNPEEFGMETRNPTLDETYDEGTGYTVFSPASTGSGSSPI